MTLTTPKKEATNLSLNVKLLLAARDMGMNLSQTFDTLLANELKRRADNREGFAAYNDHVRRHGLPLTRYRSFGKGSGDGREPG